MNANGHRTRRFLSAAILAGAALAAPRPVRAETYTWNKGSAGNRADTANWSPGTGYPAAGDTAIFTNSSGNVTLTGAQAVDTILYAPGSAARTLSGDTLSLGSLIHNLSANAQTFSCPITLAAPATVANYASGSVNINLNGAIDNNGHTLTLGGQNSAVTFDILYNTFEAGGDGNDIALRVSDVASLDSAAVILLR